MLREEAYSPVRVISAPEASRLGGQLAERAKPVDGFWEARGTYIGFGSRSLYGIEPSQAFSYLSNFRDRKLGLWGRV